MEDEDDIFSFRMDPIRVYRSIVCFFAKILIFREKYVIKHK